MMVAVDGRSLAPGKLMKQAAVQNSHAMRMPFARRALIMIIAFGVGWECPESTFRHEIHSTIECQNKSRRWALRAFRLLRAPTNRWHPFSGCTLRAEGAARGRIVRIHVGIAAGQKQSIDAGHDAANVFAIRNQ